VAGEHSYPGVDRLADALVAAWGSAAVKANHALARYTALRIGGQADVLIKAESVEMLRQAVKAAWEENVPCCLLGGGSNVLVSDSGIRGLVVLNRARAIVLPPSRRRGGAGGGALARAESGASLATLARQCASRGLAGLEWAAGIPGTVGGAVVGNAGAWGGDVASALVRATVLETDGTEADWPVERFEYGYRSSVLKGQQATNGSPARGSLRHAVVLDVQFALQEADQQTLQARVSEITARRRATQPPGATCGSVFKNPPGDHAGRLIEAAGLKGARRGGAEISPVHANFVVNRGGATAADVKALIDLAREAVEAQFGTTLELEIELLGDW
jgi:UDP-N-acetylmuramate dehydrogenase